MGFKSVVKRVLPESIQPHVKNGYLFYVARRRVIQRYFWQWRYAGEAVTCPFCERSFSQFMPSGALERPFWQSAEGQALMRLPYINVANAMCPWCRSGERHRLLYFYLRDRMKLLQVNGIKLLDVAPDKFLRDKVFSKADIEYVSIDITRVRQPTAIMDLTGLGFSENTFDAIICYHVLEHIPDDIHAMRELHRVLKPGGWTILQVPIWAERTVEDPTVPAEEYAAVYGHGDHVRRYGLDYKDRLASAGFKVVIDDYVRQLPQDVIRRHGLFETEDIYLCEKH